MNEELILKVLNVPVLVGWLAMVVAPRTRFTRWLLESDVLPLGIGVLYLVLVAPHLPGLLREFDTLEHIGAALQRPGMLLAGWIHYLAFDFLVGRVVLADAQRRGIPHLAVVPCLLLTFMLGPAGYLTYAAVRLVSRRFLPAVAPLPAPSH
ncbi:ABA4-like family protein [Hyalangium sp.]|uniref:ABA4-like family protein n=1 Tax=Hyalangium sp. TaxID=2028555 RepID=UPI002D3FCCA0|nr:ABA4-like family protein [Hyalangium sp.]HYH96991.1 ABA4-like family protein [Hyalangium sp.]